MFEIEVFKFHILGIEPPRKKTMLYNDFLKLPKQENFYYKAYQLNYNKTIINN
jgi:hypothetical protein